MTFNYNKLRGRIKEKYHTQASLSDALGMSRVSLSHRLNNNIEFSQKEILRLCILLKIPREEISVYFFTPEVQKSEQKVRRFK